MINLETKKQIGVQYTVETELPSKYGQKNNSEADSLVQALIDIPHVIDVELIPVMHEGSQYVDMVITVETFADGKVLWQMVEGTFIEQTPNIIK